MDEIAVIGPPCSGTTAVTGLIALMGYNLCGPHYDTAHGELTLEPHDLHEMLHSLVDPDTLEVSGEFDLQSWRKTKPERTVFKHPWLALFDIPGIVVRRNLDDIEKTRKRRKWGRMYGAAGAEIIYAKAQGFWVDFEDVKSHPMAMARVIATHLDAEMPEEEKIKAWIHT